MIRDGEKQIGALFCSVDLNNDGGVFSLVGHSAQGSTTRLETTVHQIWTVSALRSSKCGLRSREDPSVPSFLPPFPLPHAMPGDLLASPFPGSHWILLAPLMNPSPRCVFLFYLAVCLQWVFLSVSDFALETYLLQEAGLPSLGTWKSGNGKVFS